VIREGDELKKADLLHYVESVGGKYDDYHGRKESSAWLAVVLYVTMTIQVAINGKSLTHFLLIRFLITSWLINVSAAFFLFIYNQNRNKVMASYLASACLQLQAILLADEREEIPKEEYPLSLKVTGKRQLDHCIPEFLLARSSDFRRKGGIPGRLIDFSKYSVMVLSLLLAILGIWH
jgi:hypothetical protein